ncbi:MAG: hypothetical protein HDR23_02200 [Lachnospiraceae bacterium]|nr:hypothetical protein [Lachnospiraceae bacterium]
MAILFSILLIILGRKEESPSQIGALVKSEKDYLYNIEIFDIEDFREKVVRDKIEYMYNYYQWFYVIMPPDITKMLIEGKTYRLLTDKDGNIFWGSVTGRKERDTGYKGFYGIYKSEFQADIKELPLYSFAMDIGYKEAENLQDVGTMIWSKPELKQPELPSISVDDYIIAVEEHIKEELLDIGKKGKYEIYFGRYEILSKDLRNISAAIVGEEKYYIQYWVTEWDDHTYECWPIGDVYMGEYSENGITQEKIDRIIELERLKRTIILD